jgi:predicted Fe-Mo cluster-binding NifX family protein
MKTVEYEFCMSQFKPAIAIMAILTAVVIAWAAWSCKADRKVPSGMCFTLAAATTAPAKAINVKDKMLHPYWGNCNKCHITVNPPAKPISKVFAGAPVSINAPMPHEYWGNCNLCHQVIDGFKPPKTKSNTKVAAFSQVNSRTLGLTLQSVTAALMRKFGLANEDGVLVLEVAPGSVAESAGLRVGDEIIRVDKTRLDTVTDFEVALASAPPGEALKFNLYRGKKGMNLFVNIPAEPAMNVKAVAGTPMTQNQRETLAEQFNQPATPIALPQALNSMTQNQRETLAEQFNQPVTPIALPQALNYQGFTGTAVVPNDGKVAVASLGPHIYSQVASQFSTSPYFIIFDPMNNIYKSLVNPHFNDTTGQGIQTGQYMVDLGVKNVIAGNYSADSYSTLRSLRVNVYSGITGSVNNVLLMYRNGQVQPTTITNAYSGIACQPLQYAPTATPPQDRGAFF